MILKKYKYKICNYINFIEKEIGYKRLLNLLKYMMKNSYIFNTKF